MIEQLLHQYPLISNQIEQSELRAILRELQGVISRQVPGDIVEFGCYAGTTSLFLQRLLTATDPTRILHVYDSFAGLPPKTKQDMSPAGTQFQDGELRASKQQFIRNFKQANVKTPTVHKGWFGDLTPQDIPAEIAFAFLDGDFYESIRTSLSLLKGKLSVGAVIVVDDYQSEALPGTARAVDEWLQAHPAQFKTEASLAIIQPAWGQRKTPG